ncbi:hypothetical protein D0469_01315 [Peribacillus saganii]|uniref:Uncharacterized protein n=1 Tax=Peribacillus saganii TaxID=2303992 RepID=A0A372LTW9_9BACI|nr:hypothetical protein [Peribacillus saganii]RFU71506.1 hypothetical protein D0469_01315 [Peribacillus saganii]
MPEEESSNKSQSQRELWRKQVEKLNQLPHMKQHQLNNGWKLYTNAEFSFWDNDHNYLIVDHELDTVFVFYFKEDAIKVKKSSWDIEFTFNMKKQHIKVFRKYSEDQ